MGKTLIFISDKKRMFFPYIKDENVDIEEVWVDANRDRYSLPVRIIRKLRIPTSKYFGEWTAKISTYDKVIIFDGCYDKMLQTYLDKVIPNTPKYVFCWNADYRLTHVKDSAHYPIYSYSPRDCEKNGYKYMSTVYSKDVPFPKREIKYDVVFLGLLKDRGDMLAKLYNELASAGVRPMFYVVDKEGRSEYNGMPLQHEQLEYSKYLELISESKAILDICNPGQDGLTQRVMEAAFAGKKLISTNSTINDYNLFCAENVWILDDYEDIADKIVTFLQTPIVTENTDNIDNIAMYSVENWVNKFGR